MAMKRIFKTSQEFQSREGWLAPASMGNHMIPISVRMSHQRGKPPFPTLNLLEVLLSADQSGASTLGLHLAPGFTVLFLRCTDSSKHFRWTKKEDRYGASVKPSAPDLDCPGR